MFGLSEYIAFGAASAAVLSIGTAVYFDSRADRLAAELVLQQQELASCGARLDNLLQDLESDNAIDNLPDDALRVVPDHWLRPGASAGSTE